MSRRFTTSRWTRLYARMRLLLFLGVVHYGFSFRGLRNARTCPQPPTPLYHRRIIIQVVRQTSFNHIAQRVSANYQQTSRPHLKHGICSSRKSSRCSARSHLSISCAQPQLLTSSTGLTLKIVIFSMRACGWSCPTSLGTSGRERVTARLANINKLTLHLPCNIYRQLTLSKHSIDTAHSCTILPDRSFAKRLNVPHNRLYAISSICFIIFILYFFQNQSQIHSISGLCCSLSRSVACEDTSLHPILRFLSRSGCGW